MKKPEQHRLQDHKVRKGKMEKESSRQKQTQRQIKISSIDQNKKDRESGDAEIVITRKKTNKKKRRQRTINRGIEEEMNQTQQHVTQRGINTRPKQSTKKTEITMRRRKRNQTQRKNIRSKGVHMDMYKSWNT